MVTSEYIVVPEAVEKTSFNNALFADERYQLDMAKRKGGKVRVRVQSHPWGVNLLSIWAI